MYAPVGVPALIGAFLLLMPRAEETRPELPLILVRYWVQSSSVFGEVSALGFALSS